MPLTMLLDGDETVFAIMVVVDMVWFLFMH
jgi:hypothetical protein